MRRRPEIKPLSPAGAIARMSPKRSLSADHSLISEELTTEYEARTNVKRLHKIPQPHISMGNPYADHCDWDADHGEFGKRDGIASTIGHAGDHKGAPI